MGGRRRKTRVTVVTARSWGADRCARGVRNQSRGVWEANPKDSLIRSLGVEVSTPRAPQSGPECAGGISVVACVHSAGPNTWSRLIWGRRALCGS